MKLYSITLFVAAIFLIAGCNEKNTGSGFNINISPDAGTAYKAGKDIKIKVSFNSDVKADSIVYLLDSARIALKKDRSPVILKTDSMKLGVKLITVKVFASGTSDQGSTNVIIVAQKAPEQLTYKIEKTFPHDTSSFTEGLEYHDGYLYESDGGYASEQEGQSSLRKVDIASGKVVQKTDIDPKVFAEGITVIDGKIIQLTYHEKIGYVYDLKTMKQLSTFPYLAGAEGWGLCNDGKQLYTTTTGTNQIVIMSKDNYRVTGEIDVYDDKGPVNNLNELELINGKFYANVWGTDDIVVIDPKTGSVEQRIDLAKLYPQDTRTGGADVLNGIAYDKAGNRIFITGKKWPYLYQVKFVK